METGHLFSDGGSINTRFFQIWRTTYYGDIYFLQNCPKRKSSKCPSSPKNRFKKVLILGGTRSLGHFVEFFGQF